MATTFHCFPYLPWELRARVWELFAEPRVVHVGTLEYGDPLSNASDGKKQFKAIVSSTPIPAMLQACRESRNLGVYRQSFSGAERVAEKDLRDLKFIAPTIKRLRLERYMFGHDDATALCDFDNLEEVQIVLPNEHRVHHCGCILVFFYHGHLDRKRIILVDKANDQTTTLFEWNKEAEERFEPHREEWAAALEDNSNSSDDGDEGDISRNHIYYAMAVYVRAQNSRRLSS